MILTFSRFTISFPFDVMILTVSTDAIAGMSCISNESEPGASVNTARVFGLNSFAMSAPRSGS